ncbi:MAG: tRNA pseudouridine(38-40) synthase TruA [Gammaproteobacteria bacterium]|nr:tRNA pseudouridine(38-40) synthase TruA [Gammaproteobacteria bacterium]NIR83092.1 tRNA pseudouridine(38-40) synthase TruA [Gammaproteobacteria bacterium]NIR90754.1 tRNA pseudouridine(38-40) synthase TruA [Gammaproteobacteria bacterium]NIU04245.1 tRNA pseudouridine(38-40) synthase TruA [Gammaproteobacteria bacterium]NIV51537.1 tRNA pseudouridine(38-40) synthase TruA [Gammaproteobacteria bacterium]
MRIALGLEYEGTQFAGWETQHRQRTAQACLEQALSRVADRPVRTVCAGRTDSGVHACGQVAHFDTTAQRDMRSWVFGANANLPRDMSVLWAVPVDGEFHARFSARRRWYRYVIFNRAVRPALGRRRVTWECRPLDAERMQQAGRYLVGEHDFSSYRALACQARSPIRTVYELRVARQGALVHIDVSANAFLHHMVRNIAGVLMAVGMGKRPPEWAGEILEARDRTRGGVTAPPEGLYLMRVEYPTTFGLPDAHRSEAVQLIS